MKALVAWRGGLFLTEGKTRGVEVKIAFIIARKEIM